MKKYFFIGFSLLLLGGSVYAATTEPVTNFLQEIISTKETMDDTLASLTIKDFDLNDITTHKNSNDFSTLIESNCVDEQKIKEHKETIETLAKRLNDTDFSQILSSFGNEQLGTIPEIDVNPGKSFDRIGLEEHYERLQKESVNFFSALFTAFPETTMDQIDQNFNELIFTATYLSKWYDVKINDHSLWTLMYFDASDLTTDHKWSLESLLSVAEELKNNNYEALLSKNITDTFNKTQVYSKYTGKQYSDLIEWFVEKETGSTDYSNWFYNYFNGVVKIDSSMIKKDDVGIWNRNDSFKQNLPYLLTQKPGSNLTLFEAYRLLMVASGDDKEEEIINAIRTIKNAEAFFYRTYSNEEEVTNSIGQLVVWARDSDLLSKDNCYGNTLLLPSENFVPHGSNGAVGTFQYICLQLNGYDPGTVAHELGHSMNGLLNAGSEFLTTYINHPLRSNIGAAINTYADGDNTKYSPNFAINSDVNEVQNREELITMMNNSEDFIYAMDSVIADVVLEMPVSEQVKYIKKVPIDPDSGLRTDTDTHYSDDSSDAISLTVDELEVLNINSLDDLINNGMAIMEPSDTQTNLLGANGQGYTTPLTYSGYFLANGKFYDNNQRVINSLVSEGGWEAFKTFNDNHKGNWQEGDGTDTSIKALRAGLNDPSATYRTFVQEKYRENRTKVGQKGLRTLTYKELKNNFEANIQNFYDVKQSLYESYITLTNSFKEDPFGLDESLITEVQSYEELFDAVKANPQGIISITEDFTVPTDALPIDTFEGELKGNGHTISNGTNSLFASLSNGRIDSLVLENFLLTDKEKHSGVLSGKVENTVINDVHVVNSAITIKSGVDQYAGGLVGESINNTITNSSAQDNNLIGRYTGGLVGYGEQTTISNSYVYGGTVEGNEAIDIRVGGISGNFVSGELTNLYSSATVKDGDGFIGSTYSYRTPSIEEANSFSTGDVEPTRMKFMGADNNNKTYKNNYELASSTGTSSTGITQLDVREITKEELKKEEFYKDKLAWDTEKTWNIEKVSKDDLPYLRNSDPRNNSKQVEPLLFEWVGSVNDQSTKIEGKVNKKAMITVYDEDQKILSEETNEDGTFAFSTEPLYGNHQLKLVAKTDDSEKELYMEVIGTAPKLTVKTDISIPIGEYDFKIDDFFEAVEDRYGEENISYDIDTSQVNLGIPGEYTVLVTANNPIGLSTTAQVPITLTDKNTVVLRGYSSEERLRIGLQTRNHQLRLVEDTSKNTVIDSGNGEYLEITLYDKKGSLKKKTTLNADEVPTKAVDEFDQTLYAEGDLLKVTYIKSSGKIQFYENGEIELPFGNSGKEELFSIKNDQIIRITDTLIKTKDLNLEVGNPVDAKDFVESVNEDFKELSINYSLKEAVNLGKTGEQDNQLIVSFGEVLTKEIPIKLNFEYGNNLSLRGYQTEERFIMGLNRQNQTINFVTNSDQDSILNDVEGLFVSVTIFSKDGKPKYQMNANGEDKPSDLVAALNGQAYQEGDLIQVSNTYDNKLQYYKDGNVELAFDSSEKEELFKIANDEIIRISDELITTKPLTAEVGRTVTPEEFIETTSDYLNGMSIEYSLKQPFNPGKTGEQNNALLVSIGEGLTQEVPVKLNYVYDNNLSVRCYGSEERFIMGLDERNKTINFVTDTSFDTSLDSGSGEYITITISSSNGKEKHQLTANAEDTPSQIVSQLNGKSYQNGDRMSITHLHSGKIGLYINGELRLDYGNSSQTEEFVIKNDQIVRYDSSAINTIGKDVEITIGQQMKPTDFIENPNDRYTYEFISEPNVYKYGEQDIQIKVTDDQGQSEVVKVKLVINHESELTISTNSTKDERLTIKVDGKDHKLIGITDPNDTSVFSSNSKSNLLSAEIYNKSGELKKEEVLSGNTAPQTFIKALSGQELEIGDYLKMTSKELNTQLLYSAGIKVHETNDETAYYVVNDQWKLEPMNAPLPPNSKPDEGDKYESATKVKSNVIVEFYKDTDPALPVDPDDPSQPVDPVYPPNTIGGDLMITYASVLDFGTQSNASNEWFAKGDQLNDGQLITPFVSIKDTRGTERKGWSLTAAIDGEFINSDTGNPLAGAELYYSNLYSGDGFDTNAPEVTGGSLLIDDEGVEIAKATEDNGYGQASIGLGKLQTNGETNGIRLTTPNNSVKDVGKYTTTVTYTLVADPTLGKG